ncbi:MAG: prepilin-type N-terminal cleavage/methylation domain-containing protein [Tepidisphaera sp.]|nr:prepilin-type N-terminal cleavage/methylation domain-containing protein [Tepidisphaera sp.]
MRTNLHARRRAFSMIEMLIALTITATLLTASLAALDASFKGYKSTTESASTNVVTRMVMQRIMSMIRNGTTFGPYPVDVLDRAQNPLTSTYIEFETENDGAGNRRVVRIERRDPASASTGPYELWYVQTDFVSGAQSSQVERPLITGVTEVSFTMEYDVGPRLRRATVDLTVKPNDYQAAKFGSDFETPTIRLVSSVNPRRLDD